ncbi:glycosyl hydrolase family 71-domain-containing protein [Aspergillus ambiguus]|uniref:glycoside hydrolase family 71 protein n=1 Tax=Aspergillus ambiguus TaxID=176160 RepID=UPI003CCD06D7
MPGQMVVMPVSPWFYSNMIQLHKNWVWQGDDLWYTRWQQVLEVDPEYVEIISWNDYGESHYIGPIHDDDMDVFRYGKSPFNYAKGMPHDGWRAFLPYVIDQFKTGKEVNIDKEGVVAWYRTTPASACGSGKTTGNTETQNQDTLKPGEVLQDKIFYSALLESSADISISIGGKNRTGSWESTPDGGKGIYHGNIPMEQGLGDVVVTLSRDDKFLAAIKGHPISTDCVDNVTNWNAWVGSATAMNSPDGSSSSDQDESSSTRVLLTGVTPLILGWTLYLLLS